MAFQPGQSGNPGGRVKADPRLREMAQARTAEAFEVVLECLADENPNIRLRAAEMILERGHGKAVAYSEVTVNRPLVEMSREDLMMLAAQAKQTQEQHATH